MAIIFTLRYWTISTELILNYFQVKLWCILLWVNNPSLRMPTPCGFGFYDFTELSGFSLCVFTEYLHGHYIRASLSFHEFLRPGINVADADNRNKRENFPHCLFSTRKFSKLYASYQNCKWLIFSFGVKINCLTKFHRRPSVASLHNSLHFPCFVQNDGRHHPRAVSCVIFKMDAK